MNLDKANTGMAALAVACAAVVSATALSAAEEGYKRRYPELPERITAETPAQKEARMAWWRDARFGMFIHFGLYAAPARHEWVRSVEGIDNETYDSKYLPRFNPDLFDADEWAAQAKRAGMKYIVLTTKHHEGFCMWDTKTTDYKITKTAFGRDLVREYVDACRRAGLGVGFYFSIMDWHHPDYTVDNPHPLMKKLRNEGKKDKELEDAVAALNATRNMDRYREYMHAQIRELLTEYGKIDIIWYDFTPVAEKFGKTYKDWDAVKVVKMTRELQPGAIINNRLDLMETEDGWDFICPEQFKVQIWPTVRGRRVPWETCQTFSGSWGYSRDETRRPHRPRHLRRPRAGAARRLREVDEGELALHLRLHDGAGRLRRARRRRAHLEREDWPALHPPLRLPDGLPARRLHRQGGVRAVPARRLGDQVPRQAAARGGRGRRAVRGHGRHGAPRRQAGGGDSGDRVLAQAVTRRG